MGRISPPIAAWGMREPQPRTSKISPEERSRLIKEKLESFKPLVDRHQQVLNDIDALTANALVATEVRGTGRGGGREEITKRRVLVTLSEAPKTTDAPDSLQVGLVTYIPQQKALLSSRISPSAPKRESEFPTRPSASFTFGTISRAELDDWQTKLQAGEKLPCEEYGVEVTYPKDKVPELRFRTSQLETGVDRAIDYDGRPNTKQITGVYAVYGTELATLESDLLAVQQALADPSLNPAPVAAV